MSQPLQILHVIAELDGYSSAGQLRILVERQLADGHRVQVLALAADAAVLASWKMWGIDCRSLQRRWQYDPFTAWRLAQRLHRRRLDVLHTWDLQALNYATAVSRTTAAPLIATMLKPSYTSPRVRSGSLQPSALVTPTPCTFATQVIAPGVSTSPGSDYSREEFLAEQSLPREARLIAVAGRLVREKRIEEAIWCFELVRTLNDRARLLIFGDGPERPRWERFARLASESADIRFLGYRPDYRKLLPHVDVFWHASEESRAAPISILEAMAAQIPVVATRSAACGMVVEEAQNGYLVPLEGRAARARHTLRLLEDQQLATQIGSAGARVIADNFTAEAMTDAYAALYRQVFALATSPLSSRKE
ncbi:MAG: glycosyltransferase, partial [Pirellulales bacterium]|nr:glycosyltransferase [Pirellulales bacterium]